MWLPPASFLSPPQFGRSSTPGALTVLKAGTGERDWKGPIQREGSWLCMTLITRLSGKSEMGNEPLLFLMSQNCYLLPSASSCWFEVPFVAILHLVLPSRYPPLHGCYPPPGILSFSRHLFKAVNAGSVVRLASTKGLEQERVPEDDAHPKAFTERVTYLVETTRSGEGPAVEQLGVEAPAVNSTRLN
ncbi:hypothetical protein Pcinc_024839 [Petrolisthes cinctipes]|uniref:Uncharacterized protein n=1 Tax=Petrolisthes cinctipes TaxID=88211 RepID=A0AAE1FA35_PETCI|nr:hypothetical protein Pcinc_024839 [Petrolisthes cinctipes]